VQDEDLPRLDLAFVELESVRRRRCSGSDEVGHAHVTRLEQMRLDERFSVIVFLESAIL